MNKSVSKPGSSFLIERNKAFNTPVIASFKITRKITGRKFARLSVIMQAITTYPFSAAGIGTITKILVSCFIAFHWIRI